MRTYKFSSRSRMILPHGRLGYFVEDGDSANEIVEAHVRSGDYLSTLATQLDALTEMLPPKSDEVIKIERCVRDLLYIDSKYEIVPKVKDTTYEH